MSMVDSHNTIVLSAAPAGRFLEGTLSGALKPGHGMEVSAGVEPVGGRHTFVAFAGTTGHRNLVAILTDLVQGIAGYTCEDTVSTGQRISCYCPIPGDELLIRVSAVGTGTGDSQAIGDKLILSNGGTFIATTGTPEMEPFIVMETMSDVVAAGTLTHCMYTGH